MFKAIEAAIGRQCKILRNIKVPMRDGTKLATDVYLPLTDGPCPVVLVRTAYNRAGRDTGKNEPT